MKNKYFIERLYSIWNNLDLDEHQEFTCKYFDDMLIYFENIKEHITYDEVQIKFSEIKNLISIMNPSFKHDLKIYKKILKEIDNWKTLIETLQETYGKD